MTTHSSKTRILVTNDDGIASTGLWLMVQALASWADVYVVAPHSEQSGMSLSITVHNSLTIHKHNNRTLQTAWSVSGTPADCVKAALSILLQTPPDIIVSGINKGSNAGKNVLYSGTVGGAVEAALRGLPAIAFSSYNLAQPAFERYAPLTTQIVQYALKRPFPSGVVLNINFPCPKVVRALNPSLPILGLKLTAQGKEYILENPSFIATPRQDRDHHETTFRMGLRFVDREKNDHTTDVYWLRRGYATCVPVFVEDLTHGDYLVSNKESFETLL